jgi:glycosyltransferase involved in cell wall biosynthesis
MIFQTLLKRLPGIKLYILGSSPPEEILKLSSEQIVVTGYVRNVEPFFNSHRVFIAPLRYGAGIKGKILQSMSYGVPVVTTVVGAEGMDLIDMENAMIARDEIEFSEKIVQLYSNKKLWDRLSCNSMKFMASNHSAEACKEKFAMLFKEIVV